jgi:hypothetical protein
MLSTSDFRKALSSPEYRWAWVVAIVADALQVGAFPFFAWGALSPADDVIDVVVAAVLTRILGWHWAFLPTLVAELVPGVDLFPTWTAAVLYVTVKNVHAKELEIIPPGSAPPGLLPDRSQQK